MRKLALLLFLLNNSVIWAQTTYPTILGAHPAGVKRGQVNEVLIYPYRCNLAGAYKILFDGDTNEIQSTFLPGDGKPGPIAVRLTIAANARPGIRYFRVATPQGVSSVAAITIGDETGILEVEPNDVPSKAQPIPLPATIHGKLDRSEDIDWYQFSVEAGQSVSFAVLSSRLQFKLYFARQFIDPLLILVDDQGQELARNDDTFGGDPFLHYRFDRKGIYRIGIRDSQFHGEPPSPYQLTVTREPYRLNLEPLAVRPGEEVELRSTQAGETPHALPGTRLKIPTDWTPGVHPLEALSKDRTGSPLEVLVTDLPLHRKQQPIDTQPMAYHLPINSGFNGCLDQPSGMDWFRFEARKGNTYILEIFARRLQSCLDSVLSIHDATGKALVENDDTILDQIPNPNYTLNQTKDSRIVWTAPADGPYWIRITDAQGEGGPAFPYFLSFQVAQPDFILRCDPDDKANLGPGCSTTWHFHLERLHGFQDPVEVVVEGLPRGVSASPLTLAGKRNQGYLVLTAAKDALPDATNVRVVGRARPASGSGSSRTLCHPCRPITEIYHFGGREMCMVNTQAVAITGTSTLIIQPAATRLFLQSGGSARLDFEVKRGKDLPADMTLSLNPQITGTALKLGADPFPAGITVDQAKSKLRLGPKEDKGWLVLNATASVVPEADIRFALIALASSDSRMVITYCSPAIDLHLKKTDQ